MIASPGEVPGSGLPTREPVLLEIFVGFLAGFFTSIPPVGPIAILVIRRAILRRFREGLAIAAGSAAAEAFYAAIAVYGLDALMKAFPAFHAVFQWFGVAVLVGLGVYYLFASTEAPEQDSEAPQRSKRGVALGFTIAIVNPTLPATWSAGVAAGIAYPGLELNWWIKIAFPIAVAVGIVAWFALLLAAFHRFGRAAREKYVGVVMRVAGVLLLGIAAGYAYQIVNG